jgi:hypothetical protein
LIRVSDKLELHDRLETIRSLADDYYLWVHERSWLAARVHIIADLEISLHILSDWTALRRSNSSASPPNQSDHVELGVLTSSYLKNVSIWCFQYWNLCAPPPHTAHKIQFGTGLTTRQNINKAGFEIFIDVGKRSRQTIHALPTLSSARCDLLIKYWVVAKDRTGWFKNLHLNHIPSTFNANGRTSKVLTRNDLNSPYIKFKISLSSSNGISPEEMQGVTLLSNEA